MHFTVTSTKYKLPDGMKEVQGPKFEVSSYFRGRLKAIKAQVGVMNKDRYVFYSTKCGYKFNHLATNSTAAVVAEASTEVVFANM